MNETLPTSEETPRIMTFEEYAGHKTPYVFEVEKGSKKIVFYGSPHSYDPKDPVFSEIKEKFKELNPEVVFVEGMNTLATEKKQILEKLRGQDNETVIRERGEPSFTLKLADQAGAETESPEPNFTEEIQYLVEEGFQKDEIFAFYTYRQVDQYYRTPKEISLEDYLRPHMKEFQGSADWKYFDYSIEHLKEIGNTIWGKAGDISKIDEDESRWNPVTAEVPRERWTNINVIAQKSCYFRQNFILQRAEKVMKEKDRLLIVFGASHAYMLEPVFKVIFEKNN